MKGNNYEGSAKYWYENGHLQMECNYKHNQLQERLVRYYPDGNKEEERFYQDGQIHGLNRSWNNNGSLIKESVYKMGKLNGYYHEFYSDQRLKIKGEYVAGQMQGRWLYYDQLGNIVQITNFNNNLKDGWEVIYAPDGGIVSKKFFTQGVTNSK